MASVAKFSAQLQCSYRSSRKVYIAITSLLTDDGGKQRSNASHRLLVIITSNIARMNLRPRNSASRSLYTTAETVCHRQTRGLLLNSRLRSVPSNTFEMSSVVHGYSRRNVWPESKIHCKSSYTLLFNGDFAEDGSPNVLGSIPRSRTTDVTFWHKSLKILYR